MRTISQLLLTFLLNACWQIPLVAALATFCDWLLRHSSARYRHLLWVAALLISFVVPAITSSRILMDGFAFATTQQQVGAVEQGSVKPDKPTFLVSVPFRNSAVGELPPSVRPRAPNGCERVREVAPAKAVITALSAEITSHARCRLWSKIVTEILRYSSTIGPKKSAWKGRYHRLQPRGASASL